MRVLTLEEFGQKCPDLFSLAGFCDAFEDKISPENRVRSTYMWTTPGDWYGEDVKGVDLERMCEYLDCVKHENEYFAYDNKNGLTLLEEECWPDWVEFVYDDAVKNDCGWVTRYVDEDERPADMPWF